MTTSHPRLVALSRPFAAASAARLPSDLTRLLPAGPSVAWLRDQFSMVGWGEAWRIDTSGPDRMEAANAAFMQVAADSVSVDHAAERGSGLLAFGSFSFTDSSPAGGCLVVPRTLIGRRGDVAWRTDVFAAEDWPTDLHNPDVDPLLPHMQPVCAARPLLTWRNGMSPEDCRTAVASAAASVGAGDLRKVVLARDVHAASDRPLDVASVLRNLVADYPTTWTFLVDSMVGASPEMLVHLNGNVARSRVLAGTAAQTGNPEADELAREQLLASAKDADEHAVAADSVRSVLERMGTVVDSPDSPFVLRLPNVAHFATDLECTLDPLAGGAIPTSLQVAAALHPSAAVCGTPRAEALRVMESLETFDRDRYAAPVGWMDQLGDGEWAIALRSARLAQDLMGATLYAGGGIMGGSQPDAEFAETEAKLRPMRRALSGPRA